MPPDRTCAKDRRGDSQLPSSACAPGHIHAGQVKLHVPFDPDLVFLDTRPGESHGPQGSAAGQASQLDAESGQTLLEAHPRGHIWAKRSSGNAVGTEDR